MGKGFRQGPATAAVAAAVACVLIGTFSAPAGASGRGAPPRPGVTVSTALGAPKAGHGPDPARWVTGAPSPGHASPGGPTGATAPGGVTHGAAAGQETLNWSGELATGTTYTSVTGNWTVPGVTPSQSPAYSATWIGIGGGSSSATGLLQVGTEQDSAAGSTTYSAWVEMLPAPAYTIDNATTGAPAAVQPGDHIQAAISELAAGSWEVRLADVTQGWVFVQTFHYTGTTVTAEWIEEAPSVNTSITPLADFRTVRFTDMQAGAANPAAGSLTPISMIDNQGTVISAPGAVEPATTRSVTIAYVAPATPPPSSGGSGYDLVGADGGVFVFDPPGGAGGYYGSLPGIGVRPNKPVVGIVPTVTDAGYFLVAADGGVFSFGNAPFLGSLPAQGVVPNRPITGIVAANSDRGYFLVGQDGGVFTFGTVPYLGSLPGSGVVVNDIVGIAATPSGNGYWLIAATGHVYAFGAAQHLGTATGTASPVAAIAGTPTGAGYWVATKNGTVLAFGNARKFGTLPAQGISPSRPIVGLVHTAGTGGYWLVGQDGGIFSFGDAPFIGALPAIATVDDIVGAVATTTS